MKNTTILLALFLGLNMGVLAFNADASDPNKGSALDLTPHIVTWVDQVKPDAAIGYHLLADNEMEQDLEWKDGDSFVFGIYGPYSEPGGGVISESGRRFERRVHVVYTDDVETYSYDYFPGTKFYGNRSQDDPNNDLLYYYLAVDVDNASHNRGFNANNRNQALTFLLPTSIRDAFPIPENLAPGYYEIALSGFNLIDFKDKFAAITAYVYVSDETTNVDLTPVLEAIAEVKDGVANNNQYLRRIYTLLKKQLSNHKR